MLPKLTAVECVQKTLSSLADKQDRAAQRLREIEQERAQIAYAAHAEGDVKAIKRLEQLAHDAAGIAAEALSVETAIAEAHRRLDGAKQNEARAAEQERIKKVREVLVAFVACGNELDEIMRDLAEQGPQMQQLITQLHVLGVSVPSHNQWDVFGYQSLLTALANTIWHHRFEHLPPNQRRSFKALTDGWAATILNSLGEPDQIKEKEDAAA
jgi:flagellar biosynthesis chaperone FliJ